MKKLVFVFFALCSITWGQNTATVSGTLTNVGSTGVGTNAYLKADLYGCGGNRAQWSGGVVTAPFIYQTDVNGNISGSIVRNDKITCGSNTGKLSAPGQPVLTTSTSGGSLGASTTVFVEITFIGVISGETTISAEASITTGTGSTNSVTVATPNLPAGASGYTVYSALSSTAELKQTASSNCVNITTSCTIQVVGAGVVPPVSNTSVAPVTTYFMQAFINGSPAGPRLQFQVDGPTFNWNTAVAVTQTPVIVAPTGDATYCRLDGGNCDLSTNAHTLSTGVGTFTGLLSAQAAIQASGGSSRISALDRLFKTCYLDGVTYTTLASIIADSTNCNTAIIPPGTSTSEPVTTFSRPFTTYSMGSCALAYGTNTITVSQGVNGVAFVSIAPMQGNTQANNCRLISTIASGTFFTVGSSAGDTEGFQLWNMTIDGSGAGNGTTMLDVIRTQHIDLRDVQVFGNFGGSTTQTCAIFDGTSASASFTGYGQVGPIRVAGCKTGVLLTGVGTGGANAGDYLIDVAGVNGGSGAIGVDIAASGQNTIKIQDCNQCPLALRIRSGSNGNDITIRDEGVTADWTADNTSSGNFIHMLNGVTSFTDTGNLNSESDPQDARFFMNGGGVSTLATPTTWGTRTANTFFLQNNGNNVLGVNANQLNPGSDNAYDLGLDGSLRFRNFFLTGFIKYEGSAPSCVFTSGNGGTGNACTLNTGSTNTDGIMLAVTGSGAQSATGVVTLTYANSPYGTNTPVCNFTLGDAGGAAWAAQGVVHVGSPQTTSTATANWSNNGSNLTASTQYQITYHCDPK